MPARKSFLLRLDPRLFAAIQRWSDDELRSVNGQMEYILRDALRKAGRLPRPKARDEASSDSMEVEPPPDSSAD